MRQTLAPQLYPPNSMATPFGSRALQTVTSSQLTHGPMPQPLGAFDLMASRMRGHALLALIFLRLSTTNTAIRLSWSAARVLTICSRVGCQEQSAPVRQPLRRVMDPTGLSGLSTRSVAHTTGRAPRASHHLRARAPQLRARARQLHRRAVLL